MLRHALQRLLLAIPVLIGVLLVGFLLMQVVPTDPATVRAGPTATPEVIAAIRQDLGLDRPLWWQFGAYVGRLLHGDLGVSIINNMPVTQELGDTIGPTKLAPSVMAGRAMACSPSSVQSGPPRPVKGRSCHWKPTTQTSINPMKKTGSVAQATAKAITTRSNSVPRQ